MSIAHLAQIAVGSSALCFGVFAQTRTLIVDQSKRPGTYKTVQEAVDAATSGDQVVIVDSRAGSSVKIEGKAIWLLSAATRSGFGRGVLGTFEIKDPPPGRVLRISGLGIALTRSAHIEGQTGGRVVFDRCEITLAAPFTSGIAHTLTVHAFVGDLLFTKCNIGVAAATNSSSSREPATIEIRNTRRVTFHDCQIQGRRGESKASSAWPGTHALRCVDSTVELHATSVKGGDAGLAYLANVWASAGSGIDAARSSIRVTGTPKAEVEAGQTKSTQHPPKAIRLLASKLEISGVRYGAIGADTSSRIVKPQPAQPAISLTGPFDLGKLARFECTGQPGHVAVVMIAEATNRTATPFGELVVDPTKWFHTLPVVLDSKGRGLVSSPVGVDPASLGRVFYCQGLEISPKLELRLTGALAGIVSLRW